MMKQVTSITIRSQIHSREGSILPIEHFTDRSVCVGKFVLLASQEFA